MVLLFEKVTKNKWERIAEAIVYSEDEDEFLKLMDSENMLAKTALAHLRTFNACAMNEAQNIPAQIFAFQDFAFEKELSYAIFEAIEDDNWNKKHQQIIRQNYRIIEEKIVEMKRQKICYKINESVYRTDETLDFLLSYSTSDSISLEEIGQVLGVTKERVRQIEQSALKKLRHYKIGHKLKKYMEIYPHHQQLV